MPEPSPATDPSGSPAASGSTPGTTPVEAPPYLLAMAGPGAAPQPMTWPGPDGVPAWAIPVTVAPGTRGYALFLPLVPVAATDPQQADPQQTVAEPLDAKPAEATAAAPAQTGAASVDPQQTDPEPAADEPADPAPTDVEPAVVPAPAAEKAGPAAAATPPATPVPTPVAPQPTTSPATVVVPPAPPQAVVPPQWAPTRPPYRPPYQAVPPRPAPPSFFTRHWPGPQPAQGWGVPAAVLAGALGLAIFLPLGRTGIGWFLGWLTLTVGVGAVVRRATAALPRTERWVRAGWAGAALALLAVLAFRNAWWLVTFCVLGALICAALAIVGGRLIRSILFSLVAAPIAAFRGLPWVRRHIRPSKDPGIVRRIVGSVAATVVVLVVFGALLSSADVAFSALLGDLFPEVSAGSVVSWLFLLVVGALIAVAAVYTLAAPPDLSTVDRTSTRRIGVGEWAPAIGGLTLLFGGFVAVQFTVLFGGQRHVLRTTGLSYAEYARSGFWQLVIVTLLTLAVLGGVTRWARRDRPVERALLRVLLGLLSALSIVIVVSALSRMYTYQKVYSFTGERIFVMAFELLLGAVFLLIMAAGLRWRGTWIPRTTVGLAVLMLLSLAVLNPEDYAARRNIARYEQTGEIDAWYLRALSADATPALTKLPGPVRRCTLSWIARDLKEPDPWYAWNLGRTRARAALDRVGPAAVGGPKDCRAADQYDLPKSRR
ncbi:DUF4153 domain-containing protein [Micromonospora echinofusca]|uniref:DUF4173 domain-containing protein n=1 Tax=Micromonospora echinofusca TaxID=47858 RepID=A0ABS3VWN9_MICEH|nr:DUF4173 domain-containing protein [Micromonospora echinofusca]MBO4208913.1 DUF4173 domain-containing protein [Micromonospora echinofusca]